ncbi:MAG TPA: bacteriohemerythrin [Salinivirgaceae bacterium]|nr:bacteriohemerythrin [Salinivirgaceae bacterium]HQA76573.1 bacteriohemerythrin [Salinivirgaceae bacterium]
MVAKFFRNLNINGQMLVFVLGTTMLIFILSIGYISYSSRQVAYNESVTLAKNVSKSSALQIEKELNISMDVVRTIAQMYSVYNYLPEEQWKGLFIKMYEKVFEENPQFYKLWDSWELKAIDSTYTKDHGRYVVTYFRENNIIKHQTTLRSLDGDPVLYGKIKKEATESAWEPYWDLFYENTEIKKFMTSMSVPILVDGEYTGIVAVDITMDKIQEDVEKIRPFDESYAFLLSAEGVFVSYPNKEFIGNTFAAQMPEIESKYNITDKIKRGENIDLVLRDPLTGKNVLMFFNRVQIGRTTTPWSIAITVPVEVIMNKANRGFIISMIVALVGLIILFVVIFRISRNISKSMQHTTQLLKKMSLGEIDSVEQLETDRADEIGQMTESLNKLIEGLNRTAYFAKEIGKGNLEQDFQPLGDGDVLGNALLDMRKSLKIAAEEEEKRKDESEKQRWATEGLAKFGEILRNNSHDLKKLSFHLMSNLVNYLGANQGALFVINDDNEEDVYLEMTSAIAYNREKFVKKRVKIGEDLVGRCAHERMTIYLTDIPEDYIEITSGMGTANPRCLILVPVLLNDEVYGIIEIASFNNIEKHQIEFVEKIGESVASTISSVRVNEKTQKLLLQSQQQREELSSQEEEMRQNLEELQATQEESSRKESEMRGLLRALSTSTCTVEYDLNGRIISVNEGMAQLFGLSVDQIVGTYHRDGSDFKNLAPEEYEAFWNDLRNGIPQKKVTHFLYNERNIYLSETYTPILDDDGAPYKILKIGFEITDLQKRDFEAKEFEKEIIKLNSQIVTQSELIEKLESKIEDLKQSADNQTDTKSTKDTQETSANDKGKLTSLVPEGEPLIKKSPELETGINEIDEQHNRIITLVNQLYEAFIAERSKKEIREIIKNLSDFSSYHFNTEERYFKQFGYENASEHQLSHKLFTDELTKFSKAYQAGKSFDTIEFMLFLQSWILKHFSADDQDFVELFIQNGL